jgi:hypothetical protein
VEAEVSCCEVLSQHFLEIFRKNKGKSSVKTGSTLRPPKYEAGKLLSM